MNDFARKGLLALAIVVLISACGGGGTSKQTVAYSGKTSKAAITAQNANDLCIGSIKYFPAIYETQGNATSSSRSSTIIAAAKATNPRLLIKKVADNSQASNAEPESYCGGSSSYSNKVKADGSASGTVSFADYCGGNLTYNGSMNFTKPDSAMEQSDFSFTDMAVKGKSSSVAMSGTIQTAGNNTVFDLLVQDGSTSKTVKLSNYSVTQNSPVSSVSTFSIGGQYFDPAYGYVDAQTALPLKQGNSGETLPSEGVIMISGANGSQARMTFLPNGAYKVEVDEAGTGSWQATGN